MAAKKSFYDVLGVPKGASTKEIKQSYRRLARMHHPDVNPGDKAAEARFKEVNAAYEVLSDADKRRKYDRYGDQWQHADQIEEMQRHAGNQPFGFSGPGGVRFQFGDINDLGDLGSIFGSVFGGGARRRAPRRAANIEQPLEVTLDEAFHGTTRTLELSTEERCPTCSGTGEIAGATCHVCRGSGAVVKPRRLEVKVPAGVDTGSRVRVAGEGGGAGGAKGDLLLVIAVHRDPHFERKGANLHVDVDVPLTDAVLGGEAEVPTITGKVALKVPPLTQNGKTFRLAGLGMPRLRGQGRGDLYARVQVKLPEKISNEERKLYEELRTLSTDG